MPIIVPSEVHGAATSSEYLGQHAGRRAPARGGGSRACEPFWQVWPASLRRASARSRCGKPVSQRAHGSHWSARRLGCRGLRQAVLCITLIPAAADIRVLSLLVALCRDVARCIHARPAISSHGSMRCSGGGGSERSRAAWQAQKTGYQGRARYDLRSHRRSCLMSTTPPVPTFANGWQQATRYPDPAIVALDPRFEKYWLKLSCVERLATGCRWAEGPVYFGDGRYLLWSDIPNNRILKWEEETGAVSVYRKPSNFANGNTRDRQGRLVTCLHGGRSVVRTEYDGSITMHRRQLRRQAPQLAQRRGREVGRLDLVHRSRVRHPRRLRGLQGHARDRRQRLPLGPRHEEARPSPPRACSAPTACASRPTRRSSTSSRAAACRTASSWPTT